VLTSHQPPPPDWLTAALLALQKQHPNDLFEGVMRYCAINTKTDQPVPLPQGGKELPPDVQCVYLARIRCLDCTGKLYTPGPETTVGNFEVHLKNRQHREKVNARVKGQGGGEGGTI
jgi:SWI/SNF-related matrix-associated actin-dependent regulator of chromatin subfamily B protein 1